MFQMNQLAGTAVLEQLSSSSVSISPLANIPTIHRPKHEGICSSCNSKKRLMQTLNQTAAAVAILADAAALLKFKQLGVGLHEDTPRCFRTCDMCYRKFTCALKVARMKAGDIEELRDVPPQPKTRKSILLDQSFSFDNGRRTLVIVFSLFCFTLDFSHPLFLLLSPQFDIFCEVSSGVRSALCPKNLLHPSAFVVGQSVTVAKRMMAGVNKEGGAAIITAVTFESDETTLYNVKYVESARPLRSDCPKRSSRSPQHQLRAHHLRIQLLQQCHQWRWNCGVNLKTWGKSSKRKLHIWNGNSERRGRWRKGFEVAKRRRCGSWPPCGKKLRGRGCYERMTSRR
jgi:hypothetical protein